MPFFVDFFEINKETSLDFCFVKSIIYKNNHLKKWGGGVDKTMKSENIKIECLSLIWELLEFVSTIFSLFQIIEIFL